MGGILKKTACFLWHAACERLGFTAFRGTEHIHDTDTYWCHYTEYLKLSPWYSFLKSEKGAFTLNVGRAKFYEQEL